MELFGIAVTALAAILTYQAWKNGRWMKQAHQDTLSWMKQAHQDTLNVLERIERGQAEARKEAAEGFRRMDETLKEISHLVVAEGEKTRQAIGDRG